MELRGGKLRWQLFQTSSPEEAAWEAGARRQERAGIQGTVCSGAKEGERQGGCLGVVSDGEDPQVLLHPSHTVP